MTWHAQLDVHYQREVDRTVARYQHSGPLRILQSLYPEGEGICHNVLIHPPGGLVGGDTLSITVQVAPHSHAVITTPGATRFYRSEGAWAMQQTHLHIQSDARLEWLPLEAICYNGCLARNALQLNIEPEAEIIGWDVTSLGLPSARLPFEQGELEQHLEMPGIWLERGRIQAADHLLMHSPVGLAGHTVLATLFLACGTAMSRSRKEQALELARTIIHEHTLSASSGATSPNPQVVVVRCLAQAVEPAMQLLRSIRLAWRQHCWGLGGTEPRIWAM
jgi:urease accessory protein